MAFVNEDHVPDVVSFQGQRFDFRGLLDSVSQDVDLVSMQRAAAERSLDRGDVVAVLIVPRGFLNQLRSMLVSPALQYEIATNPRLARELAGKTGLSHTRAVAKAGAVCDRLTREANPYRKPAFEGISE